MVCFDTPDADAIRTDKTNVVTATTATRRRATLVPTVGPSCVLLIAEVRGTDVVFTWVTAGLIALIAIGGVPAIELHMSAAISDV
jgi:hypothetical protein